MEIKEENKLIGISRPIAKTLAIISIILSLVAIGFLIAFNFAGVFTLFTDSGTKYENGFTYPGYQAIYAGFGNMIIQGYTEATFNIWTFLGDVLPVIACIVSIVILISNFKRRATNKKKAIVEIVRASVLLFGGIILFNCDKLWIENAKHVTDSYTNYYETYLLPALNGEILFDTEYFPMYVLIVCAITAIIKYAYAAVLLFQKYYKKSLDKKAVESRE